MKPLIDALTARHKSGEGLIEDDSVECIVAMPTIVPCVCEEGEHPHMRVRIIDMTDIPGSIGTCKEL